MSSSLIEKLRSAARLEAGPLGFASVGQSPARAKPVILARVTGEEKKISPLVAGTDAVFIDIQQEEIIDRIVKQLLKEKNPVPFGGWLNVSVPSADFKVFNLDGDMSTVKNSPEGKVLMVEPDLEDRFVRLLDGLPVDALIVGHIEGQPCQLTLKNYMLCQRLALATSKPLLINAAFNFGPLELELMWEYGIDGMVVDIDPATPTRIKDFRKIIDKLELDPRRRKTRLSAFIPRPASQEPQAQPELPPDEEDDDFD